MVPQFNQIGINTEATNLILHMCRLCIFNSVAGGTDFYGRLEKETYLSEKPMPVSHNRNGY